MKTITEFNTKSFLKTSTKLVLLLSFGLFISCEDEIYPEAGSIADKTPPVAAFSASQNEGPDDEWKTVSFKNQSVSATDYSWDFGDGNASTSFEPDNTYSGEGTYTVTLVASDKLNVTNKYSTTVEVKQPPAPAAVTPEIVNGDFTDSDYGPWKVSSFSAPASQTRNPYNGSSDGDPNNYDGSPSGASKTKGAKYTSSTSANSDGPSSSGTSRYAYQAIEVTPNSEYYVEFSHAIKTDKTDVSGGDRILVEILDGHFDDGANAVISSSNGPLARAVGDTANGKGNFTVIKKQFTSNADGKVSIWMYSITNDEAYADNVKVYPVD
jgi:hypothetical protein